MTTSVTNALERRVRNAQEWIEGVCRQFSNATGWSLSYTPVDADLEDAVKDELQSNPNCCWHSEIRDGQQTIGFLHIELPENSDTDHSFLAVTNMADVIAQLLNMLSAATRTLDARTQEISTLVDIGLSVPNQDDLLDALKQLLRAAVQLTGFRASGFFLLEPSTREVYLKVAHHLDAHQIPHERRKLSANPPDLEALVRDTVVLQRHRSPEAEQWLPPGTSTALCVAVQTDTGPIGTLWAFDRRSRTPSDREIHVLEALGAQIASILERVVLLRESETQLRLQRELKLISESQPLDTLAQLPEGVGFDAAGRCRSRYELGGDLCELIPIGRRRAIIAVGDASGDSIPAAMIMTAVRGALRALADDVAHNGLQIQDLMERLNRSLYGITAPHQFMSFVCGILDSDSMSFTYTNAGHPTPLLVHDGSIRSLKSHGIILGVSETATYGHSNVKLSRDDMLVFFSDGIIEAMSESHEMFRSDGIISAIKGCVGGSAQKVMQQIWRDYEAHAAAGSNPDDRTLLVIEMRDD